MAGNVFNFFNRVLQFRERESKRNYQGRELGFKIGFRNVVTL